MSRNTNNHAFLPIKVPALHNHYKNQVSKMWFPLSVDISEDRGDWDFLVKEHPDVSEFLINILCFFSQLDGIVCENIDDNFIKETSFIKECTHFYPVQGTMEVFHNEMYSILIDIFIRDPKEKEKALNSIDNYASVGKIVNWIKKWMAADIPLVERIVAFCCLEGVLFQSAFAGVIYVVKQFNRLKGLGQSNELIRVDESIHTDFGIDLYKHLCDEVKFHEGRTFERLTDARVHEIIRSALDDAAIPWIKEALKVDLIGLKSEDMVGYVQALSDQLLEDLGHSPLYKVENPLPWMVSLAFRKRTNFFERKVAEYHIPEFGGDDFSNDSDF